MALESSSVILTNAVEPKEEGWALKTEEYARHYIHPRGMNENTESP